MIKMAGKKPVPDAPTRVRNGITAYRNTFGPPHLTNKWLSTPTVLAGLELGALRVEDLPLNVMAAVNQHGRERCGADGPERGGGGSARPSPPLRPFQTDTDDEARRIAGQHGQEALLKISPDGSIALVPTDKARLEAEE